MDQETAAKPKRSLDSRRKIVMAVRDSPPGCGSGGKLLPAKDCPEGSTKPMEAAVGSQKPTLDVFDKRPVAAGQSSGLVTKPMEAAKGSQKPIMNAIEKRPIAAGQSSRFVTKPMKAAVGSQKPTINAFQKRPMVVRDFPPSYGSGAKLQPAEDCPARSTKLQSAQDCPYRSTKLQPAVQDCPARNTKPMEAAVGSQKPTMKAFGKRPLVAGQSSVLVKKTDPEMDGPRKTQSISLGGKASGSANLSRGPEMARPSRGGGITARDTVEASPRYLSKGRSIQSALLQAMDQETAAKPKRSFDSRRKIVMAVRDSPPGCGSGGRLLPAKDCPERSTKPMEAAVGSQKPTMNAFEKRPITAGQSSGLVTKPMEAALGSQNPTMNEFGKRRMSAGQSSGLVKKMVHKMDGPKKAQSVSLGGKASGSANLSRGPEMARPSHGGGITARDRVEECLRMLRDIYKSKNEEPKKPAKEGGKKVRVDIQAYKQLRDEGKLVNQNRQIPGPVDGVNIGDKFYYQSELYAVGVHRQLMKGIDSVLHNGQMVAASIVASRSGSDDMSDPNVLVYCGEGGTSIRGEKHEDQQLRGGNLALKNSISANTPVRVIRKVGATDRDVELVRSTPEVFIYDGLYRVVRMEEENRNGCKVYIFTLTRDEGQPHISRH